MPETVRNLRQLRIIAQDPAMKSRGRIVTEQVDVPAEEFADGPWGYRVHVIDYDTVSQTLYRPLDRTAYQNAKGEPKDPFEGASDDKLLDDPRFHQQNVYAIVMRTLARFEFALGRRVSWSFDTHQLKIAPHAFADANAFYSGSDEALMFGYFQGKKGPIFTCLSHDIVAHETTHALLDGLRERFVDASSPDQGAFHEGFSDIVALLSVFSLRGVARTAIAQSKNQHGKLTAIKKHARPTFRSSQLTAKALKESALLSLAEQMGQELSGIRGDALRRSAQLTPSPKYYSSAPDYVEPHTRGEILVAAMLNALLGVWLTRIAALDPTGTGFVDQERVVEEGSKAADHLLTIAIRALDYCMPVHIEFGDYLSALLTADHEVCPDDSHYGYRDHLRTAFAAFGIKPASTGASVEKGIWLPPEREPNYGRNHFESLRHDRDEVFRFIWENREEIGVTEDVYTRVLSVRPCLRIGPDGFALHETVSEYMQCVTIEARELSRFRIKRPAGMPLDTRIFLQGGGTLIFDEFGRLKFNIRNRLDDTERQSKRIGYMWREGYIQADGTSVRRGGRFSELHRLRALGKVGHFQQEWH